MHPRDFLPRDGEHPERVVGAQVMLGREREFSQVFQSVKIVRMNPGGVEALNRERMKLPLVKLRISA